VFALASYTWSKSIDTMVSNLDRNALAQSVFLDPKSNRAVSDWDVPHRFSLSFIGEVPYGSGRRYGGNAPALARTVLGGWQVTGIFIARSGMPGTVVVSSNPIAGIGNARPNLVGNPELPASERTPDHWFNTAAFARNIVGGKTLPGNAGRNVIRGPGYVNLDLGFAKYLPAGSRRRAQFRVEIFNVFNRPQFALPVLVMDDPAFGKITHTRNPTNFGSSATSFASRMIQLGLKLEF
jgi:hypothetical protein